MPLTLRAIPTPDFAKLTPVQRFQFRFVMSSEQPRATPTLTQFFSVHDATGAHVYDMHLYAGDDGQVFVKGTKKRVAGFSQGGADCGDEELQDDLDAALRAFKTNAQRAPKKKTATSKKKTAIPKKKAAKKTRR